ncbi:hypothetical protein [Leptolyngbya sp. FACHB-261]|uniref:hypothetical protein n=1 Tax=Leptolyngbya sp. FACHB-261 TaxID=2692806 RepID=UPI0016897778|nr:hypothetical protein [Leptolyngbya sp. FACHB-261]MBD2103046.1 hypothetical protein [Leptolyngbya sp. FACHB-261]
MVTDETKLSSALEAKLSTVLPELQQLLKEHGVTEPTQIILNVGSSNSSLASEEIGTKCTKAWDSVKEAWVCR